MVYDDDLYLQIWLSYWERFVPRSSLYVLIHADYEHYEELAKGCNTIRIARPPMQSSSEIDRWKMLSRLASGLTYMFDRVIYTDVDEVIALDPEVGDDPIEHILGRPEPVISPFGVDVVEAVELNLPPIDITKPILSQRRFIAPTPMYSKPCIISEEIDWASGGHYSNKPDVYLSDALTLFHLRLFDKRHYDQRSLRRKEMISDPETGEMIEGLGGSTWRKMNAFDKYFIEKSDPMEGIEYGRLRRRWTKSAVLDENGHWIRRGYIKKKMSRIPERFTNLF